MVWHHRKLTLGSLRQAKHQHINKQLCWNMPNLEAAKTTHRKKSSWDVAPPTTNEKIQFLQRAKPNDLEAASHSNRESWVMVSFPCESHVVSHPWSIHGVDLPEMMGFCVTKTAEVDVWWHSQNAPEPLCWWHRKDATKGGNKQQWNTTLELATGWCNIFWVGDWRP